MIEELKKIFEVEEVQGDNYNDITVMLCVCNSIIDLSELWDRLKCEGKFNKLSKRELIKVVSLKNNLKKRLLYEQSSFKRAF